MAGGLLNSAALTAYDILIDRFEDASSKANCGSVKWTGPLVHRFSLAPDGFVKFDGFLHLRKWKARKETVSVLIQIQETIRRSQPPVLIQSTVRLCYFDVDQQRTTLMHSIRFDYDEGRPCHPLFHAQLCPETIKLSPEDAEALDFDLPPDAPKAVCFKNARIPTSDMTFPSVLLCLAADHMGQAFFSEFMESVRGIHGRMPLPAFEKFQQSMAKEPGHLRSFHWFAHMEEPSS